MWYYREEGDTMRPPNYRDAKTCETCLNSYYNGCNWYCTLYKEFDYEDITDDLDLLYEDFSVSSSKVCDKWEEA